MKNLSFLIIAVTLLIGLDYVGAWTAPIATPPSGNVDAPVHTGSANQSKSGNLFASEVGGLRASADIEMLSPRYCNEDGTVCLEPGGDADVANLNASSSVNSAQYCDENGANCSTAVDIQSALGGSGAGVSTQEARCYGQGGSDFSAAGYFGSVCRDNANYACGRISNCSRAWHNVRYGNTCIWRCQYSG